MAKRTKKLNIVTKDPAEYAHVIEFGSSKRKIPERPLFRNTLEEYAVRFNAKVFAAGQAILGVWK